MDMANVCDLINVGRSPVRVPAIVAAATVSRIQTAVAGAELSAQQLLLSQQLISNSLPRQQHTPL